MKARITSRSIECASVYSYRDGPYTLGNGLNTTTFVCLGENNVEAEIQLKGNSIPMFDLNHDYEIEIKIKEIPKVVTREHTFK